MLYPMTDETEAELFGTDPYDEPNLLTTCPTNKHPHTFVQVTAEGSSSGYASRFYWARFSCGCYDTAGDHLEP